MKRRKPIYKRLPKETIFVGQDLLAQEQNNTMAIRIFKAKDKRIFRPDAIFSISISNDGRSYSNRSWISQSYTEDELIMLFETLREVLEDEKLIDTNCL